MGPAEFMRTSPLQRPVPGAPDDETTATRADKEDDVGPSSSRLLVLIEAVSQAAKDMLVKPPILLPPVIKDLHP
jgi:hypothetical protein